MYLSYNKIKYFQLKSVTVNIAKSYPFPKIILFSTNSLITFDQSGATLLGASPDFKIEYYVDGSNILKNNILSQQRLIAPARFIDFNAAKAQFSEDYFKIKEDLNNEYGIDIRDNWLSFASYPSSDMWIPELFKATDAVNKNPEGIKISPEFLYTTLIAELGQILERLLI